MKVLTNPIRPVSASQRNAIEHPSLEEDQDAETIHFCLSLPRNKTLQYFLRNCIMNSLSAVSSWSAEERPGHRLGDGGRLRCGCDQLSADQRRLQVLEAEAELRRLRDRVRKAIVRWSAAVGGEPQDSPFPVKRSRVQRPAAGSEPQLVEVDWSVTAEQLVEHLCFWRHSSALACINLTDCLKELTPRSEEPAASKRALTLVWWDMELQLEEAVHAWRLQPDARSRRIVHVGVGDIVPLFVWEVDLLRTRPLTRRLCRAMLEYEIMDYARHSGVAGELTLEFLRDNPLYATSYGAQPCRCTSFMRNAERAQAFRELRRLQLEARANPTASAVPRAPTTAINATHSVATEPASVPVRRRRLDESLVTEVGGDVSDVDSSMRN